MKGIHYLKLKTNKVNYEFEFKRKINIINDLSGTGKTTFVRYIETLLKRKNNKITSSLGIEVLNANNYKYNLMDRSGNIFILDESEIVDSIEFAKLVKYTNNYLLIITRESMGYIPYSVEAIHRINTTKKDIIINKIQYKDYIPKIDVNKIDTIITEDSGSGLQFFSKVKNKTDSLSGNSKILDYINDNPGLSNTLFIVDGSAFGGFMEASYRMVNKLNNVGIIYPESFEFLLLESDIFKDDVVCMKIQHPYNYSDIKEHLTWETFFYSLLREEVNLINSGYIKNVKIPWGQDITYRKDKLGNWYMSEPQFSKITNLLYTKYLSWSKLNW